MKLITARSNPQIKNAVALKQRKFREREGKLLIEGVRLVEDARAAGVQISLLFCTEDFVAQGRGLALTAVCREAGVQCYVVSAELMSSLSSTTTPQGVVAVAQAPVWNVAQVLREDGLILVVDRVQDPGNLGTIIRTAAGAGCSGVVVGPGTVDLYNEKVIRASMGAVFRLPVVAVSELADFFTGLKEQGVLVVGATGSAKTAYWDVPLVRPGALVIGNEAWGVDAGLLEMMDVMVKIPLAGGVESLNAAMAAGIILFEWVRQSSSG